MTTQAPHLVNHKLLRAYLRWIELPLGISKPSPLSYGLSRKTSAYAEKCSRCQTSLWRSGCSLQCIYCLWVWRISFHQGLACRSVNDWSVRFCWIEFSSLRRLRLVSTVPPSLSHMTFFLRYVVIPQELALQLCSGETASFPSSSLTAFPRSS